MIYNSDLIRSGGIFDLDAKKERLEEVERLLADPDIWSNPDQAQAINQEKSELTNRIEMVESIDDGIDDQWALLDLIEEDHDQALVDELAQDISQLVKQVERLEFQRMFSGKMDANNAFIEIQAGSGGTEAQDWAAILMRMYLRWAEQQGFDCQVLDVMDGDVAGIKSCMLQCSGEYAYGWLRTETGVHRLVRKSPFDSGNRRHTSFASVYISPEVSDTIEIRIDPSDLRIDTFRAAGAGGQHVNKTDSAVRITHEPTGIVVQSQNDRSQHKNKAQAMKQLQSKLYEREAQAQQAERQAESDAKSDIGWGSQIRSYVLDQSRIKDLRTNVEVNSPQNVLDGGLNVFIEASLKAGF